MMSSDLVMDIWLKGHDLYSDVFEKMGREAEGLRGKIGLLADGVGVLAGGVLAESVKQASSFSSIVNHVAANTTMTTQGIKEMSAAIQDMASHSSAHMADLAQAWMHVTDLGFTRATDAQKVVPR
jgi:methyl-accepting chemotaxis protein